MSGLVGAALVNLNNGAASPHREGHAAGFHGSAFGREDTDWKVFAAMQKEQLEEYKQATEQVILERYYALERNMEHMMKAANRFTLDSLDSSLVAERTGSQDSSTDSTLLRDLPMQLEKMIRALERRTSDEQNELSEKFTFGIKSMEATLEREIGKQAEAISTLSRKVKGLEGHARAGEGIFDTGRNPASLDNHGETAHSSLQEADNALASVVTHGKSVKSVHYSMQSPATSEATTNKLSAIGISSQDCHITKRLSTGQENFARTLSKATNRGACNELGQAVGLVNRQHRAMTHDLFTVPTGVPKNRCHAMLQQVVHSASFVMFMEFCILANVVIKGVQMDCDVRRAVRNEPEVAWGYHVDVAFTMVFVVELLLRMFSDGQSFLLGCHWGWNLFDAVVVIVSLWEVVTDGASVGFLRIFRSVRLVRVLKVVRVFRFFRELRLMAVSIASCATSLFWALVLIFLVIVCFAMFCLEGSKTYLLDNNNDNNEIRRNLAILYGSFPEAIYSLVKSVSGGGDWGTMAAPLLEVSWMYGAGFALFVSFVTLGMMNVLIGIFVENAQHYSQIDRDLVIQEEMDHRESYMNQLRELFFEMDADGSGTITYEEFETCLSNDRAKAYLDFLQLNAEEAQGLFMLLDLDENCEVGVEEFVLGCMRLKGTAKSIDAASMMFQTKRLAMKVNELHGYTHERLEVLINLAQAHDGESAV